MARITIEEGQQLIEPEDVVSTKTNFYEDHTVMIHSSDGENTEALFERMIAESEKQQRIEQDAGGNIRIMSPAGGESANRNIGLSSQFGIWTRADGRGSAFDSNTLFRLPDGAKLGPDRAWINNLKLVKLSRAQRRGFMSIVPEFIVEIKSPTDHFSKLQTKMQDWIRNGVELGWLIHPDKRLQLLFTGKIAQPGATY